MLKIIGQPNAPDVGCKINRHLVVVRPLLDKGAAVDTRDKQYGQTPLSWAATIRHKAMLRFMLE